MPYPTAFHNARRDLRAGAVTLMEIMSNEPVNTLPPERIPPISCFFRRGAALFIDCALLALLGRYIGTQFEQPTTDMGPYGRLLGFFIAVLILGASQAFLGQTLGKKIAGIRVLGIDGSDMTPARSFLRAGLLCAPYFILGAWLPFGQPGRFLEMSAFIVLASSAYLYFFASPARRTLHDLAAGTIVVRVDQTAPWARPSTPSGHYTVVAGLSAVYLTGAILMMRLIPAMFPAMTALATGLIQEDGVAGVQFGLYPFKRPDLEQPVRMLQVVVLLKKLDVAEDNNVAGMANTALRHYPEMASDDMCMIVMRYGYDLGLWRRFKTRVAAQPVGQWRAGAGIPDPQERVSYTGVGVSMTDEHPFVIVDVFARSAAARGGLKPGDVVLTVDGRKPKDNDEALGWMRGTSGSVVKIEVSRASVSTPIAFTLTRGEVDSGYEDMASSIRDKAEKGDHQAELHLGELYANGLGVPQSYPAALDWYRKAAAGGEADAFRHLGEMHIDGTGVEKNDVEAVKYFRLAAEKGSAVSMAHIGMMHMRGQGGLPKDDKAAYDWLLRGAQAGNKVAQHNVAGYLYNGNGGIPLNRSEAALWYKKAAENGLPEAQYSIGGLLQHGNGIEADVVAGTNWVRKAADQGHVGAQRRLGQSYRLGVGVDQDVNEARKWLSRAASHGDEEAARELKEMDQ